MDDFFTTARDQILGTLELANQALAALEHERQQLEEREAQLREFIRLGDAILAPLDPDPALPAAMLGPLEPDPVLPAAQKTAAQRARLALEHAGHALSLTDIVTYLHDIDLPTNREAIKTALRTHPSVFTHPRRGVYGLRAWGKREAVAAD